MYTVYGATFCSWCTNVKDFLITREVEFTYHDIQKGEGDWEKLSKEHGFRTIPQVFKDGVHIGGFNELVADYDKSDD